MLFESYLTNNLVSVLQLKSTNTTDMVN